MQPVNVGGVVSDYLTLTYTRAIGRDDASYSVEASTDLSGWVLAIIVGSPTFNGNGTETLVYRHPNPKASDARQFLRLRINEDTIVNRPSGRHRDLFSKPRERPVPEDALRLSAFAREAGVLHHPDDD